MRALRKSNPRITDVRCWLPVVPVKSATLLGALIAGGRHTHGWSRDRGAKHRPSMAYLDTSGNTVQRHIESGQGLFVPSRHPVA